MDGSSVNPYSRFLRGRVKRRMDEAAALLERLERTLDPRRHALARLPATLPAPYGWFEHALAADRLLLAALARRGDRDLAEWPGKGVDAPLYELDGAP